MDQDQERDREEERWQAQDAADTYEAERQNELAGDRAPWPPTAAEIRDAILRREAGLDEDYVMEVPGRPKVLPQQVTDAFFRGGRVGMSDQDIHREGLADVEEIQVREHAGPHGRGLEMEAGN